MAENKNNYEMSDGNVDEQRMEEYTIEYLAEYMIAFGMSENFTIGLLNSMETLEEKALLLKFFMMSTEENLIPTKEQIGKAVTLIKQKTTR